MSKLTIYTDNHSDSTVISNHFIDEYMKDANDAQLKIYLYLVRLMNGNRSTSVSDIADKFNHTEKDVLRALKYWEKNCLLALDFDESKALVGIHLQDLDQPLIPRKTEEISLASSVPFVTKSVSVPERVVPRAETPHTIEKPSYSLDQLKEFKNNTETEQLFFIVESYLGKTLSANEMKTILFIYDRLGFSVDLIDYLIQYCVDKGKKELCYIEKVAISWAEDNITSVKQAKTSAKKYDKAIYVIMKSLGKNSIPTEKEVSYITRWTKEFAFTYDIITEACDRTVLATDSHRFEYADSILTSWHKEGIHHKEDIKLLDDSFQKSKNGTFSKAASNNKFNQFTQNSYDFDALEKEILSN